VARILRVNESMTAHTQWWLSLALFGLIVLAFVIAALAIDPLSASVP
jgi:hypothetical protein